MKAEYAAQSAAFQAENAEHRARLEQLEGLMLSRESNRHGE
jgi:hypothetical protein